MLGLFWGKLKNIQNKLLLSFILLIIIPFGLFAFFSLNVTRNAIEQEVSESNLKTLGQIAEKMEMVIENVIAISNIYFLSSDVSNILSSPNTGDDYQYRRDLDKLSDMTANYAYVFGSLRYTTTIIGYNGRKYFLGSSIDSPNVLARESMRMEDLQQEAWYDEAVKKDGRAEWVSYVTPSINTMVGTGDYVTAVRVLKNFVNNAPLGLLFVSVNEQSIAEMYQYAPKEFERIILVDQQGRIISSKDKGVLGEKFGEESYRSKIFENYSGYFIDEVEKQDAFITFYTIEKTGWKIVAYTPLDKIMESTNKVEFMMIISLIGISLVALILSYIMSRMLSVPIKMLYNDMSRVEKGDMSVRSQVNSKDEIGELAVRFNDMVATIQKLMEDLVEEQQMKRKAELQSLQAQVNPHFLYNTLASIRFMLGTRDIEVIDRVIVALVRLLKKTLSKESEIITIGEEIENLKNYIVIQKVRQGEKLQVEYEIEEEIVKYTTIKLILQPIVENAIFHGIEPKQGEGTVRIKGELSGSDIIFKVVDDGIGMNSSIMEKILEKDDRKSKFDLFNGIGLKTIHERIVMHFGEEYGLKVEHSSEGGTSVTIRIPAVLSGEVR